MNEKDVSIANKLFTWQGNAQEQLDTDSDVKVYNLIGNVINMVLADIMEIKNVYEFIDEFTTLNTEERTKAYAVITSAESITRDELKNEETDKDE